MHTPDDLYVCERLVCESAAAAAAEVQSVFTTLKIVNCICISNLVTSVYIQPHIKRIEKDEKYKFIPCLKSLLLKKLFIFLVNQLRLNPIETNDRKIEKNK